jgi:hypothetical protein
MKDLIVHQYGTINSSVFTYVPLLSVAMLLLSNAETVRNLTRAVLFS